MSRKVCEYRMGFTPMDGVDLCEGSIPDLATYQTLEVIMLNPTRSACGPRNSGVSIIYLDGWLFGRPTFPVASSSDGKNDDRTFSRAGEAILTRQSDYGTRWRERRRRFPPVNNTAGLQLGGASAFGLQGVTTVIVPITC